MEWLAGILAAVIVAPATAWVTVQFALDQFRRERWWEKRLEAYTNVIEALHHVKRYLTVNWEAAIEHRNVAEPANTEMENRNFQAWRDLRRAIDVGELLFSPQALQLLDTMNSKTDEAWDSEGWPMYLDTSAGAVEECLQAIRAVARRDLDLPGTSDHRPTSWE